PVVPATPANASGCSHGWPCYVGRVGGLVRHLPFRHAELHAGDARLRPDNGHLPDAADGRPLMFGWLQPRIGHRAAVAVTALWYALLIALVLLFAVEPAADFRYDDL